MGYAYRRDGVMSNGYYIDNIFLRRISYSDLIKSDDHNSRIDALNFINSILRVIPNAPLVSEIQSRINAIPRRSKGDYVYSSDFNDVYVVCGEILYSCQVLVSLYDITDIETLSLLSECETLFDSLRNVRYGEFVSSFLNTQLNKLIYKLYLLTRKLYSEISPTTLVLSQKISTTGDVRLPTRVSLYLDQNITTYSDVRFPTKIGLYLNDNISTTGGIG